MLAECKDIIEEFLIKNKTNLNKLKKDKNKLKELITILKKNYNISLRRISEVMKINREKIRKLYKE